jgi:uncharacterized repeat protein (TIGR01451 family)
MRYFRKVKWSAPLNKKKNRSVTREAVLVRRLLMFFTFAFAASMLAPGIALAAAHVELVETVAAVETHAGKLVVVPRTGITRQGERLRYTIAAKNTGDRAAVNLTPIAKIPGGLVFIAGTAGTGAEFSVDAGKTFSPAPTVRVTNPGGTTTTRPALPHEYNAIRWADPQPLAPGARITFAYDVIVE